MQIEDVVDFIQIFKVMLEFQNNLNRNLKICHHLLLKPLFQV